MVIFISGVYGVGKSTLCQGISRKMGIPAFSASDLISAVNGEKYGANKVVRDKNANQEILINAINRTLKKYDSIILAGHFCIFDKNNEIEILPNLAFTNMHIGTVLLLEADTQRVVMNLSTRDTKHYSPIAIEKMQLTELQQAEKIASDLSVPLLRHKMRFDGKDAEKVLMLINEVINESFT